MNRTLKTCAAAAMALAMTAGLYAQDTAKDDEVTLADVVVALEKINAQLADEQDETVSVPYEPHGFGGGPRFELRYMVDMADMNAYADQRGDYEDFGSIMYPFVNSGSGTWRWVISPALQIGWDAWGGGFSGLGQKNAAETGAVDADTDGLDDFYSYASYGVSANDFVIQWKTPLVKDALYLGFGGRVGVLSESFSIDQNERSVTEAVVSALAGTGSWSRASLDTGAYATLQFQPDPEQRWFRLSLTAGFDYPAVAGDWTPSAGVHVSEAAPPAGYSGMNAWLGFGFDFNL